MNTSVSRRTFLRVSCAAAPAFALRAFGAAGESEKPSYENNAKGMRILPGAWRPHYPWEHIAWVSPSWPSQDYIWLDFPEALFTDRGLLYLSHINPAAPAVYSEWPRIEWKSEQDKVSVERVLPDGVSFFAAVIKERENVAGLELRIRNGSDKPLREITLQTCAFLRAIREFADYTRDNKYVHVPNKGWMKFEEARALTEENGKFGLGWRTHSNRKADLPMMATVSNKAERLVAMTWLDSTLSLTQNHNHPCMHADPHFNDLEPGQDQTVRGRLIFHEGPLSDFPYQQYL
ncbi:MAG: hypothetical protein HUU46_04940 [Candidatus Hydrogenedentes bacterium]|nr:hypothetical protein [Candidatus Hydrogenedentota bacterium]